MSILEKEIMSADKACAKCLEKCQGCQCRNVKRVMNLSEKLEKAGTLTKEDKDAYLEFMRG